MILDRIRQSYDRARAFAGTLSSWVYIALAVLAIVALALVDSALVHPLISQSQHLYKYLSANDNNNPQFSAGSLDSEVQATLDKVLPPSWSGHVLYQRVERWAPKPLDDSTTRDETLRQLADNSPLVSFSYIESGNTVLAGYNTLLSEMREDAGIRARSPKSRDVSVVEKLERHVFALGEGSFTVAEIDAARQRIEKFDVPNPETQFSPHPPVTFDCDLGRWLRARPSTRRRQLSSVEMQIAPGDIMAAQPALTSNTSVDSLKSSDFVFTGDLQTTVQASDWMVCVIKRPWLQENILERLRGNIDPFVDTRDLFGTGGALAAVPYALVVAKDVTVEITFSDSTSFENVKNAVARGQAVQIEKGGSRLIVEGSVASFDEARHSIVVPAISGTSQVMFVVSKLY